MLFIVNFTIAISIQTLGEGGGGGGAFCPPCKQLDKTSPPPLPSTLMRISGDCHHICTPSHAPPTHSCTHTPSRIHVPLAHPPLMQWRIRGQKKKGKERRGSGHVLERCSSNSTLSPSPLEVTSPPELGGCGVCGGGRE